VWVPDYLVIEVGRTVALNIPDDRLAVSHQGRSFGIEATKTDGNVQFTVGGQDVIDIINDSIARFARPTTS
jgi:hypothetical protein